MKTLLLDNSYFPVQVVTWQKAMILAITGRAEVVEEYNDHKIRSVNLCYNLPKVLRLFCHARGRSQEVKFTRYNVFWRDKWTCQYCAIKLGSDKLTFDHVIPRCRGGATSWENVVTSCQACNVKKGGRLLKQTKLKLLGPPKRPSWSPQLCLRLKESDLQRWEEWLSWLVPA